MSVKERALKIVNKAKLANMGTIDELGRPQIKAFIKARNHGLTEFWFCSNTSSKRAKQIAENETTCLYFTNNKWEGVLLNGVAKLSYDDEIRQSFWSDDMYIYYPKGALDPDFVLIKFTATSGNYYKDLVNEDFDI